METGKRTEQIPLAPAPPLSGPEAAAYRTARPLIDAECRRFVCRCCRTKTLWPHKLGCEIAEKTRPECADCRYWSAGKQRCDHPAVRRERAAR